MNEEKVKAALQYVKILTQQLNDMATALEHTARAAKEMSNLKIIGLEAILNQPEAEENKEEQKPK